jgi:hypothetical protein
MIGYRIDSPSTMRADRTRTRYRVHTRATDRGRIAAHLRLIRAFRKVTLMKLKAAAIAVGLVAALIAAPASANAATVHPATGGPCNYSYAIWFGYPISANAVHLSVGSDNCAGPFYAELVRVLPGGGTQFVAFGQGVATYACQGSAINTYQSTNTLNGEVLTMANVACG